MGGFYPLTLKQTINFVVDIKFRSPKGVNTLDFWPYLNFSSNKRHTEVTNKTKKNTHVAKKSFYVLDISVVCFNVTVKLIYK